MTEILFYIVLILSFVSGIGVFIKTKAVGNPIVLLTIFFNIPLLFNRFELAGIQPQQWHHFTYTILSIFNIIFIIIPALFYLKYNFVKDTTQISKKSKLNFLNMVSDKEILFLLILSAIFQIVINKINCGFFFPFLHVNDPLLANIKFHTVNVRFWGFFINSLWYFSMIVGVLKYLEKKHLIILIFLFLSFITPLARLARLDTFAILIIFGIIIFERSQLKWKHYVYGILISSGFLVTGILLMWFRTTNMNLAENGISHLIDFKVYSGPFDVFAFLYSYFSLSFENLNLFVIKNWEGFNLAYGAYTFRPLLVGILKVHVFWPSFPMHDNFNQLRDYLAHTAMVPTCIPEFMLDFGLKLSFIPMLIYSVLGNILYLKREKNDTNLVIYWSFVPAYLLASFQNLFISPLFLYVTFFIMAYIVIKRRKLVKKLK